MRNLIYIGVCLLLAACAPAPSADPVIEDPFADQIIEGPADDETTGLIEREPDTCGAENYQTVLGQSRVIIDSLGIGVPVRVIEPDSIVTQEYNPQRINFTVNGDGFVTRVACG